MVVSVEPLRHDRVRINSVGCEIKEIAVRRPKSLSVGHARRDRDPVLFGDSLRAPERCHHDIRSLGTLSKKHNPLAIRRETRFVADAQ